MKVVAFNGSPRKGGNNEYAINLVKKELEAEGVEVEVINVGRENIRGCLACNGCIRNRDEKCVIKDPVNDWIQKMKEADGIIISSPVYFAAINGTMKSFLDRAFYVAGMNKSMFRNKVGVAIAAVRRSGGIPTFNQLNNYLNYGEMILPTSNYWNVIHGTTPGEAAEDKEGVQIMEVLGKNMVWALKMREMGEDIRPELVKKTFTNFVRK